MSSSWGQFLTRGVRNIFKPPTPSLIGLEGSIVSNLQIKCMWPCKQLCSHPHASGSTAARLHTGSTASESECSSPLVCSSCSRKSHGNQHDGFSACYALERSLIVIKCTPEHYSIMMDNNVACYSTRCCWNGTSGLRDNNEHASMHHASEANRAASEITHRCSTDCPGVLYVKPPRLSTSCRTTPKQNSKPPPL